MEVLDPGHRYRLQTLDEQPVSSLLLFELQFVKRIGEGYPGNKGIPEEGTILQDVLRCCIDRVKYLDNQKPHQSNLRLLEYLRWSIKELELRAAKMHGIDIYVSAEDIELLPTLDNGHLDWSLLTQK